MLDIEDYSIGSSKCQVAIDHLPIGQMGFLVLYIFQDLLPIHGICIVSVNIYFKALTDFGLQYSRNLFLREHLISLDPCPSSLDARQSHSNVQSISPNSEVVDLCIPIVIIEGPFQAKEKHYSCISVYPAVS